jgi:hypothetical protein
MEHLSLSDKSTSNAGTEYDNNKKNLQATHQNQAHIEKYEYSQTKLQEESRAL